MGQNGTNDTLITQIWPMIPEIFEILEASQNMESILVSQNFPQKFSKMDPIFPGASQILNISGTNGQNLVIGESIDLIWPIEKQ